MICKHITKRSYQRKPYIYCRSKKETTTFNDCKTCSKFESRKNQPIKKKSNKLGKLERERKSILTDDLEHCFTCKFLKDREVQKEDLHEIYQGKNRKISIKNGFVAPVCRKCHEDEYTKIWLKKYCQLIYEENHTREEFRKLIEDDFLD